MHMSTQQAALVSTAAVTKYHRAGALNNRHLFLIVLEVGSPKIKVLADLAPGESSVPASSLCPHRVEKELW